MATRVLLARCPEDSRSNRRGAARSRLGQAVTKAAIERLTDRPVAIARTPAGRPVARWADGRGGAPPGLSISYCPGWVGAAVAEAGRVGLDLERSCTVAERVALRVMAPLDARRFRRFGSRQRRSAATRYWTCAESLAKARGGGLPLMLARSMTVGFGCEGEAGSFRFAVQEAREGLVCALAADSAAAPDRVEAALLDPAWVEELSDETLCSIAPTIAKSK